MRSTRFTFLLTTTVLVFACSIGYSQLDPSFGNGGVTSAHITPDDRPLGSFLLPDQKILVVTENLESVAKKYFFMRFNGDGTPDQAYGIGGKVEITGLFLNTNAYGINRAIRQPDGKIILLGTDNFNGLVARLNENGTFDSSFVNGGIHRPNINQIGLDTVTSGLIQPDGKILIAGNTAPQSVPTNTYLLRYHPNGLLDKDFGNEGFIIHSSALVPTHIFLQSTGKIVLSTASARFTGADFGYVRRFNSDGTVDGSFSVINFGRTLRVAALQSDDKILVGEVVDTTDALERKNTDVRISRYSSEGVLDSGFGTAGMTQFDLTSSKFDDSPNGVIVAPDGSIVVSVIAIMQPNRTPTRGSMVSLARLTSSGSLNGKFLETKSLGVYDAFLSLYPDGKILNVFQTFTLNGSNFNIDLLLTRATGVPLQNYKFRGVPFDFSFSVQADGRADPTIFRPSDSRWYFYPQSAGFPFGVAGDILVASDYIKDTGAERAVFRPSEGRWYISQNYSEPNNFITVQWGLNSDIPAPGDFDGDGKTDVTVFRPSDGVWYIRGSGGANQFIRWGTTGDKPAPGDFDGDGIDDVAIFRPSSGDWYILRSSDGQPVYAHFGLDGDVPVQEDYDGDGKADIAVWRPSTGIWYRLNSSDGSFFALGWGLPTDVATPADYDGDLKTDITVWRPSQGRWYIYQSSTNGMAAINWGLSTDVPAPAKN